jgi:hypothetical protein
MNHSSEVVVKLDTTPINCAFRGNFAANRVIIRTRRHRPRKRLNTLTMTLVFPFRGASTAPSHHKDITLYMLP